MATGRTKHIIKPSNPTQSACNGATATPPASRGSEEPAHGVSPSLLELCSRACVRHPFPRELVMCGGGGRFRVQNRVMFLGRSRGLEPGRRGGRLALPSARRHYSICGRSSQNGMIGGPRWRSLTLTGGVGAP